MLVRTLLLRVDARELVIDRDNEDDIDTIELQPFSRAEMQSELAQRRVDALPVPRNAEQSVRELFNTGAVSQCVVLSMFAASVSSAQRIADSAASRQHAAQLTHLAPTAAAAAAAKANAERTRLALNNNVNATQANPIALARPPAQRLPGRRNDGRKSGTTNCALYISRVLLWDLIGNFEFVRRTEQIDTAAKAAYSNVAARADVRRAAAERVDARRTTAGSWLIASVCDVVDLRSRQHASARSATSCSASVVGCRATGAVAARRDRPSCR